MATLAQLRQALARAVDAYLSGTVTDEVAATPKLKFRDTRNLTRFSEDKAINGVTCQIIASTDGLAPEGESAYVAEYTALTKQIELSFELSADIDVGDTYGLYLKPWITLANWNQFITRAIYESWPELYYSATSSMSPKADYTAAYALTGVGAMKVDGVMLVPTNQQRGAAGQLMREGVDYVVYGEPGALTLQLLRPPQLPDLSLQVAYRLQYPALNTETATTTLDTAYILNQARAEYYLFMADKSRGKAHAASLLQLVNYFRAEAQKRKMILLQSATGQMQLLK